MRHGFVWLLVAFSAAGGMVQGYSIGLASGLAPSTTFKEAFPELLPNHTTPSFVSIFLLGCAELRARRRRDQFGHLHHRRDATR